MNSQALLDIDMLDKNDADTCFKRGIAFYEQNMFDLAISDFSAVIKTKPELTMAYAYRAMSYNQRGQFALAISDLNKFMEIEPELSRMPGVYYYRGCMHFERAGVDASYNQGVGEAIWDLIKAEELDPLLEWPRIKLDRILSMYSGKTLFEHIGQLPDEKQNYLRKRLRLKGIIEEKPDEFKNKLPKFLFNLLYNNSRAVSNSNVEMKNIIELPTQDISFR